MTRATVRLTVEIECSSSWTEQTTAGQIFKQAEDEARGVLRQLSPGNRHNITVIGIPEVISVITKSGDMDL